MSFPCTSCGACCRRVGLLVPGWPWLAEDGKTCTKLTPDNQCSIYQDRPLACQIDALGERLGVQDKVGWYDLHARLCNLAQIEDGMGESYRVKVENEGS